MKHFFLSIFLLGLVSFVACDKDDNDQNNLPVTELNSVLKAKYPNATHIEWSSEGLFYEADFKINNNEHTAWFNQSHVWYMTESDIAFDNLPVAVKNSFKASDYANWVLEDVDQFERFAPDTVYVIEVEKGTADVNLVYAKDGRFLKTIIESEELLNMSN